MCVRAVIPASCARYSETLYIGIAMFFVHTFGYSFLTFTFVVINISKHYVNPSTTSAIKNKVE
jgi:hypothetical protein